MIDVPVRRKGGRGRRGRGSFHDFPLAKVGRDLGPSPGSRLDAALASLDWEAIEREQRERTAASTMRLANVIADHDRRAAELAALQREADMLHVQLAHSAAAYRSPNGPVFH